MFVCRHMRYGIYIRLSSPGKNEGDRVAFLHLILEKDKYVLDILFFKAICYDQNGIISKGSLLIQKIGNK